MHACGIEHELRYGQIRGGYCEWHCCGSEKAWAVAEGEGQRCVYVANVYYYHAW